MFFWAGWSGLFSLGWYLSYLMLSGFLNLPGEYPLDFQDLSQFNGLLFGLWALVGLGHGYLLALRLRFVFDWKEILLSAVLYGLIWSLFWLLSPAMPFVASIIASALAALNIWLLIERTHLRFLFLVYLSCGFMLGWVILISPVLAGLLFAGLTGLSLLTLDPFPAPVAMNPEKES